MYKSVSFYGAINERTGYGIHGSRFCEALEKLIPVFRNEPGGEVSISLIDSVSIQNVNSRLPYPSLLYNVWESTEQPDWFIEKLKFFDGLLVPSEWQKSVSIAQGIPEEFIKVVPEGVDPDVYKPDSSQQSKRPFTFVHVGQWQPRKSTIEIIEAFQKAFPIDKDPWFAAPILELSVDTLFPSDNYKSTEERLEAYGLNDPRIRVIHFEERDSYIRRLQSAHCFVSCSRSEGWGLPIIEAMAVGVPTIVADFGGSTEYATDAIRVNVPELKKPTGIFGDWDVPGKWGEPDYDHLVEQMKDVCYNNYAGHYLKALETSEKIRDQFSWKQAAVKAYNVLEELYKNTLHEGVPEVKPPVNNAEDEIRAFARKYGFEVALKKIPTIAVIGTWPNSQAKMETLVETITQMKALGHPVMISTHYPLPPTIVEQVDYVLYEKKNVLSGEWRATYTRSKAGKMEQKQSRIPYHGVACLNAMRNAIDFCSEKFSRMIYIEYDCGVEVDKLLAAAAESSAPFTGISYEGRGMRTDIWAADMDYLWRNFPHIRSWEEYTKGMKDIGAEYPLEFWLYNKIDKAGLNLIKLDVDNIYDQTDRELWEDDDFQYHFVEGPYLNIAGISNREYKVSYGIDDRNVYTLQQKAGMWSRPSIKYYLPWIVTASLNGVEKFRHVMDLKDKRVLISFGSKALGDTIAWMPYVDEFRKKHGCHIICSGWWQEIFDYPEVEFIKPGTRVENLYATYEIGCFDNQAEKNPKDWRTVPLQKVAADILGLKYEPIRAKLKVKELPLKKQAYIAFSEYSTMQNKQWNREGAWQELVNGLYDKFEMVSVSFEKTALSFVTSHNGQGIHQTISDIAGCSLYIGLNHGPAWIAYALGKPVVMITGVSEAWNDFPNPYRIQLTDVCRPGCFNDPSVPMDRGWSWCPRNKNFACTREVTPFMVLENVRAAMEALYAGKDRKKGKKVSGKNAKRDPRKGHDLGQSESATASA